MPRTESDPPADAMQALLERARPLVADNEAPHRVKDASKWELGALIAQMQDLVKYARESVLPSEVHATPDAAEAARKIAEQYSLFLPDAKQHKHQRGVLVDYAAVARLFPEQNRVRTELSHSHARALARVKAPGARAALAEQAILLGWSVARLQAEINTAGLPPVKDAGTEDGPVGEWAKTQNSTWVCAQTGKYITDREPMVELRVQPEATLDAKRERGKKPGNKRGAAARKGRNDEIPDAPRVLRFESASALYLWLEARLEAAGPVPNLGHSGKPAGRVIVSPTLKKPLTAKSCTGGALSGEALTEQATGEHPAEEG